MNLTQRFAYSAKRFLEKFKLDSEFGEKKQELKEFRSHKGKRMLEMALASAMLTRRGTGPEVALGITPLQELIDSRFFSSEQWNLLKPHFADALDYYARNFVNPGITLREIVDFELKTYKRPKQDWSHFKPRERKNLMDLLNYVNDHRELLD